MSAKIHVHRNTFWTWKLHFSTKQKIYVKANIALKSNNAGKSQPNKSFDNFFCVFAFSQNQISIPLGLLLRKRSGVTEIRKPPQF